MIIAKIKRRIIIIQEISLILENKPKNFAIKENGFFILPLLSKCKTIQATFAMGEQGLSWIILHL